jgi:hypothetical protein
LRRDIARALATAGTGARGSDIAQHDASLSPRSGNVFCVPGGRSFHIAGCPIIEGKDGITEVSPREARAHGLEPCKLCTD